MPDGKLPAGRLAAWNPALRKIPWLTALGVLLGKINNLSLALLVALLGTLVMVAFAAVAARHFYLQREELRLMPVRLGDYLADNTALSPPVGLRVVFFGDSRINGWDPRPRSGGMQMIWRGINGETTAQMVHRFHQDVIALHPDAVVIEAGINDLVAGSALGSGDRAAAQAVDNLQRLASQARASSIEVYLLTILKPSVPPLWRLPVWSPDIYSLVDSTNALIRGLAGDGIRVVDADRQLSGSDGRMPKRLARDTLHLNEDGYKLLNRMVEDALGVRVSAVQ